MLAAPTNFRFAALQIHGHPVGEEGGADGDDRQLDQGGQPRDGMIPDPRAHDRPQNPGSQWNQHAEPTKGTRVDLIDHVCNYRL